MNVLIPSQLRDYTGGARARGSARRRRWPSCSPTSKRRYPGIRFRMIDEQDAIRRHIKISVNQQQTRDGAPRSPRTTKSSFVGALSGGRKERGVEKNFPLLIEEACRRSAGKWSIPEILELPAEYR